MFKICNAVDREILLEPGYCWKHFWNISSDPWDKPIEQTAL